MFSTDKFFPFFLLFMELLSEKAMATHSSTLAWKIPWTEEPGGLQSMGSLRVGHDWATSLSLFIFMHWRRRWQPTAVFLPGESQGRGAWWAAVYAVAQSSTRLKWLSSMELLFFSSFPFCWFVSYIFVCFFLPVIPKCCKCTYCGISKKFMLCLFIANQGLFIFCINIPGFI